MSGVLSRATLATMTDSPQDSLELAHRTTLIERLGSWADRVPFIGEIRSVLRAARSAAESVEYGLLNAYEASKGTFNDRDRHPTTSANEAVQFFLTEVWFYRAIDLIASDVSSIPVWAHRSSVVVDESGAKVPKKEKLTEGPAFELLALPNPQMSWKSLLYMTVVFVLLTGKSPWEFVPEDNDDGVPMGVYLAMPWQIRMSTPAKRRQGDTGPRERLGDYFDVYDANGIKSGRVFRDRVVWIAKPNPADLRGALGPAQVAGTAVRSMRRIRAWDAAFWENGAAPEYALTSEKWLDPKQEMRQRISWYKRHGNKKGKGRGVAIVMGGMKLEEVSRSHADAEFVSLRKLDREEILAALGVPPARVGLLEFANYSNMDQQDAIYWKGAPSQLMALLEDAWAHYLLWQVEEGASWEFDRTAIQALAEDAEKVGRLAKELHQGGLLTANEARAVLPPPFDGLPPNPDGDVLYAGGGQTAKTAIEGGAAGGPGGLLGLFSVEPTAEGLVPAGYRTEERSSMSYTAPRLYLPQNAGRLVTRDGRPLTKASSDRDVFEANGLRFEDDGVDRMISEVEDWVRKIQLSIVDELPTLLRGASTVERSGPQRAAALFTRRAELTVSLEEFLALIPTELVEGLAGTLERGGIAIQEQAGTWSVERMGGGTFILQDVARQEIAADMQIRSVFTTETQAQQIRALAAQMLAGDHTAGSIARAAREHVAAQNHFNALRIVRTEAGDMAQGGLVRSYEFAGVASMSIITARDSKVRRRPRDRFDHTVIDGQTRPVGDLFDIDGEEARWPRDGRTLSAANRMHCRCGTKPNIA